MISKLKELLNIQILSAAQTEEYQRYLTKRKKLSARMNSSMAIFLFLNMTLLDFWLIPSNATTVFAVNCIVILTLAFTFYSTFQSYFIEYYQGIIALTFIIPAYAIEYTMYLARPEDIAYFVMLSPLIVSILIMYSLSHLSTKMLIVTTLLIIGGLVLSLLTRASSIYGTSLIVISHVFFVTGALLVGVFARILRINYYKENFLLQHSLTNVVTQKTEEVEKFEYYSNHDQLTGLSNRRFAEKNFSSKKEEIDRSPDLTMVLMFLDLNRFKAINDKYGHEAGDKVLRVTAERLRECTPCTDNLVRLGGDEFLLCLTIETNNKESIQVTRNSIENLVSQPIQYHQHILNIGTSIGCAIYPEDGQDLKSLIKVADKNMYEDKLSNKVMIPRKSELKQLSA